MKNLVERDPLEDLGLYVRITLKWILTLTEIIVLMERPGGKRPLIRPSSIWRITLKWTFRLTEIIVLMEKPGGKRPLRRPRSIWEDNYKMDFQVHRGHCLVGKT